MSVILGQVIRHPRQPRVHVAAAKLLRRHDLPRRGLHQGRTGEEDRPLFFYNNRDIRHGRHIGPARRAGAHHDRDLRNARRTHLRLVVEDAPEMVPVGKDLVLVRKVRAAAVHQVDAGQTALLRDLLRAQVLLHGDRVIGPALHGRVVADDHDLAAHDAAHARDGPRRRCRAVIHPVRRRGAHLEERRARVEQVRHPLPRQHLAARHVPLPRPRAAARRGQCRRLLDDAQRLEMGGAVGARLLRSRDKR
jgi:hypothetical protein